jgi:tRNA A-37 threonylcarbamoyl transferase component Bud32
MPTIYLKIVLVIMLSCFDGIARERHSYPVLASYLQTQPVLSVTPLRGGESYDQIFKIKTPQETWVLRILNLKRPLEKRRLICEATDLIAQANLGPQVIWHDPSYQFLITHFIEGYPLTLEDMREPRLFENTVLLLRKIHDTLEKVPSSIEEYSLKDRVLRRLKEVSVYLSDLMPSNLLKIKIEKINSLHHSHLVHGDIKGSNILKTSSGVFVIDLGEVARSSIYDDLGGFSFSFGLSPEQEKRLLHLYFGTSPSNQALSLLKQHRWLAEIHHKLWSIRRKMETGFDPLFHKSS